MSPRDGTPRSRATASGLLAWLASLPPGSRDAALEEHLGLAGDPPDPAPPGDDLVGYHASGVAPIVRALLEVPVLAGDVFVDLGSGLGKVVLLAALLTGATARGIELQPALVARAREAASRLALDVTFTRGDARDADLHDGTVFFLYAPFTGPVLAAVLERLRAVAERRALVVCTLGVDLPRVPWLVRRALDSFWLAIYDAATNGVSPRRTSPPGALRVLAETLAFERHWPG